MKSPCRNAAVVMAETWLCKPALAASCRESPRRDAIHLSSTSYILQSDLSRGSSVELLRSPFFATQIEKIAARIKACQEAAAVTEQLVEFNKKTRILFDEQVRPNPVSRAAAAAAKLEVKSSFAFLPHTCKLGDGCACCLFPPALSPPQIRTGSDDFKVAKEKFTVAVAEMTAQRTAAEETTAVRESWPSLHAIL